MFGWGRSIFKRQRDANSLKKSFKKCRKLKKVVHLPLLNGRYSSVG